MQKEYDIKEIFEEIENELILSMKRTLWSHKADEKVKGFKWPQWQAMKIKQMEDFKKANQKIFNNHKNTILDNLVYKEMKKQFREGASRTNKDAIRKGIIKKSDSQLSGSFFGLNDRIIKALMNSVDSDLNDVRTATLRMANDQYRQIIYKAEVYAGTGAKTVKQAIDMASQEFLLRGFNCIEYSNGSRHNIANYCDMAIRTANKRANLMGEGEMRKKLGNPLVYISKHGGACDKCIAWQGRVYIDDVWSGGKKEDGKYPLLSTAIEGGLFHPRCQHGSSTYYEGINDEPKEVTQAINNEHEDEYTQALQRQKRQYERLALGSLLPENVLGYQNKVNELQNQIDGSKIELSDEEKKQLTDYTGFDATRINKALRLDDIDEKIQKKIELMDSAFKKTKPLKKDIILHRGTIIQSISGFEKRKNVSHQEIMNLKENFVFDKAFVSTSKGEAEGLGRNIIMTIHVPKGFKEIIDIEPYALEKYKYQKEVLINRNTKFYIKDIKFKDNKYYFEMEVIE